MATRSITITEPEELTVSLTGVNVRCFNDANGQITTTVSGGTEPYSYNWSNSMSVPNLNGLIAGTYSVIVTDDQNCEATAGITITQPNALQVYLNPTPAQCGGSGGSVFASIIGGT